MHYDGIPERDARKYSGIVYTSVDNTSTPEESAYHDAERRKGTSQRVVLVPYILLGSAMED
jgi:hypothetical protein